MKNSKYVIPMVLMGLSGITMQLEYSNSNHNSRSIAQSFSLFDASTKLEVTNVQFNQIYSVKELKELVDSHNIELNKLKARVSKESAKNTQNISTITSLRAQLSKKQTELASIKSSIEASEKDLKDQNQALKEKNAKLDIENSDSKELLSKQSDELKELKIQFEKSNALESELVSKISALEAELEAKNLAIAEKDTQLTEKEKLIAEKEAALKEKEAQISETEIKVKKEIAALENNNKEMKDQNCKLERRLVSLEDDMKNKIKESKDELDSYVKLTNILVGLNQRSYTPEPARIESNSNGINELLLQLLIGERQSSHQDMRHPLSMFELTANQYRQAPMMDNYYQQLLPQTKFYNLPGVNPLNSDFGNYMGYNFGMPNYVDGMRYAMNPNQNYSFQGFGNNALNSNMNTNMNMNMVNPGTMNTGSFGAGINPSSGFILQ